MVMVAGVAWWREQSPWQVVKMPATFLLGPQAVLPAGFAPQDIALGLAAHLGASILVGVLFAWALPRLCLAPLTGGLLLGGLLYLFGFWVLPLLFPHWLAPFWLPPPERALQALAHAVYGVIFGLTYRMLRPEPV